MNNRFNNVSAIRGTTIRPLDVPTRASTTSHIIALNASAEDIAAIQEMETRLAMQEQAAARPSVKVRSIHECYAAHPMEFRVATPAAHPMHVRFAVPAASEERIREFRGVHFAQPQVQPARVRHLVASEAAIAWGQAQTRHTQLCLQLRAMNVPPQTPLLRAVWEEQYRAKFRECEEAAREEIRLDLLLQQARCS